MTLFPPGTGAQWQANKKTPTPPPSKSRKKKSRSQPEKRWQRVTSFRIPHTLKATIKHTAKENGGVSAGEVVTLFLRKALEDYQAGILVLTPVAAAQTLYPVDGERA